MMFFFFFQIISIILLKFAFRCRVFGTKIPAKFRLAQSIREFNSPKSRASRQNYVTIIARTWLTHILGGNRWTHATHAIFRQTSRPQSTRSIGQQIEIDIFYDNIYYTADTVLCRFFFQSTIQVDLNESPSPIVSSETPL